MDHTLDFPPYTLTGPFTTDNLSQADELIAQEHILWRRVYLGPGTITVKINARLEHRYRCDATARIDLSTCTIDGQCSCNDYRSRSATCCAHIVAAVLIARAAFEQERALDLSEEPDSELMRWLIEQRNSTVDPLLLQPAGQQLRFILDIAQDNYNAEAALLSITTLTVRPLKRGGWSKPKPFYPSSDRKKQSLSREDLALISEMDMLDESPYTKDALFCFKAEYAARLIEPLLATGRCHWREHDTPALSLAASVTAKTEWKMMPDGTQYFHCSLPTAHDQLLPTLPLWCLNSNDATLHPVETAVPAQTCMALMAAPGVPPAQVKGFIKHLQATFSDIKDLPLPTPFSDTRTHELPPTPVLSIQRDAVSEHYGATPYYVIFAEVLFRYGDNVIYPREHAQAVTSAEGQILHQYLRDLVAEQHCIQTLKDHLQPDLATPHRHDYQYTIANESDFKRLATFKETIVPTLSAAGWHVEFDKDVLAHQLLNVDSWYSEVVDEVDAGYDWFSLNLGVVLDGKKINLLPHLIHSIQHSTLTETNDGHVLLQLPEHGRLAIPKARMDIILGVLTQLIDPNKDETEQTVLLSRYQATLLIEIEKAFAASQLRWFDDTALRQLGQRLSDFSELTTHEPPASFTATLRPYQQHGVNWLQFLRRYQLNGILADDMGLGKTIQALAHIMIEKQAKRLSPPCLIIAPTSVVHNWQREIEQFAPTLNALVLQGDGRKEKFAYIAEHDIILTTYPLLARDKEVLLQHHYDTIILDEAQMIKNAQAKMTQIVQQLKADYRLCLTGTPLENHLGELWSLFHFLMPGFLGSAREFAKRYRTPIEKHNDTATRQRLAQLLKPFVLRRSKKEVIKELPDKTEITHTVTLGKQQRDLYEGVRLSMHEKIRKVIDQRGIARSHIIILDALLKLRQICCDPKLLNLEAAKKVDESKKLEALMEMLTTLLSEGRRILLFSQFTSMLALIEHELKAKSIRYVTLTGSTKDRVTPVQQFQDGEVPLFLISLKAGGTGLNLTAADTVIHYDPWWNPAVEQQATDRAHRIGQDKTVFVYKLVAANTVEEKILLMQQKKKALVDNLFTESSQGNNTLTKQDLDILFA